jgi:hypothetical protein
MRLGIHGGFRGLRHSKCLLVIVDLSGDFRSYLAREATGGSQGRFQYDLSVYELEDLPAGSGFLSFFSNGYRWKKKVEGDNTLAK